MSGRVGMSRGICPDPVFLGLYHEGYCPGGLLFNFSANCCCPRIEVFPQNVIIPHTVKPGRKARPALRWRRRMVMGLAGMPTLSPSPRAQYRAHTCDRPRT